MQEAGQDGLVAAGAAADLVRGFEECDLEARLREQGRGGEPVGPAADDDGGRHDAVPMGDGPSTEPSASDTGRSRCGDHTT